MNKTPQDFYNKYNGKSFDCDVYDARNGYQRARGDMIID